MNRKNFEYKGWRMDEEPDEDEKEREDKRDDLVMLNKKLEKYFLKEEKYTCGEWWMTSRPGRLYLNFFC